MSSCARKYAQFAWGKKFISKNKQTQIIRNATKKKNIETIAAEIRQKMFVIIVV